MRGEQILENPCKKWFEWSGSEGKLTFYNKETEQKEQVELPFRFMVLDELATIKGYDKNMDAAIWSNEVRNTKTDVLNVKIGKHDYVSGFYLQIKDKILASGGKFAVSCYIAFFNEKKELQIGNIMFKGSSFGGGIHKPADKNMKDVEISGWYGFKNKHKGDIYKMAIEISKDERLCVNGSNKFFVPAFKLVEVSEETDKKCIELAQNVLKPYLDVYLNKTQEDIITNEVAKEVLPPERTEQEAVLQNTPTKGFNPFGQEATSFSKEREEYKAKNNDDDFGDMPF